MGTRPAVSEKKLAANKANAQRSTGPRSPEGKARSSRNATTHGIYAGVSPIPAGEFAEDPDAVDAFVGEVIDGLSPRNGLERRLAVRVATALLQAARLDQFAAMEIAKHTRVNDTDRLSRDLTGSEYTDREVAASNALSVCMERITALDARVGLALERGLASFWKVRQMSEQGLRETNPLPSPVE